MGDQIQFSGDAEICAHVELSAFFLFTSFFSTSLGLRNSMRSSGCFPRIRRNSVSDGVDRGVLRYDIDIDIDIDSGDIF